MITESKMDKSMTENVILVDKLDNPVGEMEKMEAHEKAILHRAFSVFVFNDNDELMLQQRAFTKYHSPGLWTNTCCSHPRPGEDTEAAAHRRLIEEMGFDCEVEKIFDFIYKAGLDKGLTEHEFDHVFVGRYNQPPVINTQEAESWKWMKMDAIAEDMKSNPESYTVWFRIAFDRVFDYLKGKK
jgi:isopentenyl-diphosphate Delta-isomerase